MRLTLLLDLDDTLLDNDIEVFLPEYMRAFQSQVASVIDPQRFSAALMRGTEKMVRNLNPDRTLKEVFDACFFPELGIGEESFRDIADRFYTQVFPTLAYLTQPRQEAIEMVNSALARGYRLAVATNPLFPLIANLHRLSWAQLPVENYPFELVSSYETFHFAKPHPAFFAEFLARMGWPEGPVVVVGDDLERDIKPSLQLGILAYWVTENKSQIHQIDTPVKSGGLEGVIPWLDQLSRESLDANFNSQPAMIAILRATPASLDSIFREVSVDLLTIRPHKGEWCLTEILCHLRDVEIDVNLPRLRKALNEENPFMAGENTDTWAQDRNYIQQDAEEALLAFIQARIELLNLVMQFDQDDWRRMVNHSIFGPTQLEELIRIIASHDRLHLNQIFQVLTETIG